MTTPYRALARRGLHTVGVHPHTVQVRDGAGRVLGECPRRRLRRWVARHAWHLPVVPAAEEDRGELPPVDELMSCPEMI